MPKIEYDLIERLKNRINEYYLRERLITQVDYSAKLFGRGLGRFHIENFDLLLFILKHLLKITGLYRRGFNNFKNIQIVENEFYLRNLPSSFIGFRIAHLSDLHLDINPEITDIIINKINKLDYDLCVLTGDFRFHTHGDYNQCLDYLSRLTPHLNCNHGVYAVLGNHDFIEMVPIMEDMGINLLLNEAHKIKIGEE